MKKLILISIFFILIKTSPAQTFNCFIANDSLEAANEYVFEVYIQSTDSDFLFRSFQGCFTFPSQLFIPSGAAVTASYDSGSTQLNNYTPGTITYSSTAPGFMTGVNQGPSCATGTLISTTPIKIGTFRMTITNGMNFGCVPSNPNMVLPGDTASGLALRTAITKWDSINCAVGTSTNITVNGMYTQSGPHTLYKLVNNMAPSFIVNPVTTTVCENSSVTMSIQIVPSFLVGLSGMYYWIENGVNAPAGHTAHGIYSGNGTATLTIDSVSASLNGSTYFCQVAQCNVRNSDTAILYVNNAPNVNLGPDTILQVCPVHLDAGPGFLSYSWSTGETTAGIDVQSTGYYWVTVFDSNGCTATDTILVDCISSVNDLEENNYSVFPSLTTGKIYFKFMNGIKPTHAKVNDLSGRIVLDLSSSQNEIDISSLTSGCYILEFFRNENSLGKKKIIKQ